MHGAAQEDREGKSPTGREASQIRIYQTKIAGASRNGRWERGTLASTHQSRLMCKSFLHCVVSMYFVQPVYLLRVDSEDFGVEPLPHFLIDLVLHGIYLDEQTF